MWSVTFCHQLETFGFALLQVHGTELGGIWPLRIMFYSFLVAMSPSASISSVSPKLRFRSGSFRDVSNRGVSSFRRNLGQSDLLYVWQEGEYLSLLFQWGWQWGGGRWQHLLPRQKNNCTKYTNWARLQFQVILTPSWAQMTETKNVLPSTGWYLWHAEVLLLSQLCCNDLMDMAS